MKGLRYFIPLLVAFLLPGIFPVGNVMAMRGGFVMSHDSVASHDDPALVGINDEPSPCGVTDMPADTTLSCDDWSEHMAIKSNLPVWLAAIPNMALEFDLSRHFSISVSVYYCGWNYFREDVKFRNLTAMPELRYWPRRDNMGFFCAVHGGVALYNVAFGAKRRYQDHDGNTPALGGGINIGYKFPLRSRHWNMEVSLGAGAYRLDYDIFLNKPNGMLIDRKKRMFYGIDNAALSVSYFFSLKKKGGRQ